MGVERVGASQEDGVMCDVAIHVRCPVFEVPEVLQDIVLLVPLCMTGAGARGVVNDSEGGQVENALAACFCMVPSVALAVRPSYICALQWSSQVGVHRGSRWHSWSLLGFLLGF